jgi:hypothetical protein
MKSIRTAPQIPARELSAAEVAYLLRLFGHAWRTNNRLMVLRLRGRDLFRRYWYIERWDLTQGEVAFSCYPERAFNRSVTLEEIAFLGPAAAPEIVSFALALQPASPSGR